jgi:hypothetical protein
MLLGAGAALMAVPLSQLLPAQMAYAAEQVSCATSCQMSCLHSPADTTDTSRPTAAAGTLHCAIRDITSSIYTERPASLPGKVVAHVTCILC